jgi:hypothetical protein
LGTIVLTRDSNRQWEVADGQQRLATTAILIAAIRDYLIELGDTNGAKKYETDYLIEYDPRTKEHHPKLELNSEDNQFFAQTILKRPHADLFYRGPEFSSHKRLTEAAALAHDHVRTITANLSDAAKMDRLYDFVDYLDEAAVVIVINVPGDIGNAFTMFETLNARGLRASQVDILKNYLFERGRENISELRARWTSMLSSIETCGEDDLLISFIRHYWISQYGPTTEKELGDRVRSAIKGERQAVDFIRALDSNVTDYIALLLPREHAKWAEFSRDTRNTVYTITRELGAEQIRPLMLAVMRSFERKEVEKAFKLFLSWTVRFLVVGGAGGGQLERQYGLRAAEVTSGDIKDAKRLANRMLEIVPNDQSFRAAFSVATVRRNRLARYYLRALELFEKGEAKAQIGTSEDTAAISVEHVLPVIPNSDWETSSEVAEAYYKRLGNMVLVSARENARMSNSSFALKRQILKSSPFVLTSDVAQYRKWGPKEIERRQQSLAELAIEVWPST